MDLIRALIALLLAAASAATLAQPVRLFVSTSAGTPMDMIARSLAAELSGIIGQIVVIDNLPGSSGNVATDRLRRSEKTDGTELLFLGSGKAFASAPDVTRLVPVAAVAGESSTGWWMGIFAPPGTPALNARELGKAVIMGLNSSRVQSALAAIANRPGQTQQLTLAPGDGAQLTRLVAQSTGGGSASVSGSLGSSSSGVSPSSGSGPKDATCNSAAFDPQFKELTRRNPQQSNWGMNDTYRYSYFLGSEGLKILQKYRSCMSDADFAANYDALKGMRDKGREGCLKTSSNGDCQPSYPGSAATSGGSNVTTDTRPCANCRLDANGRFLGGCPRAECGFGNGSPPTPPQPRRGNTIQ